MPYGLQPYELLRLTVGVAIHGRPEQGFAQFRHPRVFIGATAVDCRNFAAKPPRS